MISCQYCQNKFKNKTQLRKHYSTNHKDKKPFSCTYCDMKYAHQINLNRHIHSQHQDLIDRNIDTSSSKRKMMCTRFNCYTDYKCDELTVCETFHQWIQKYRELIDNTNDKPLSESVEYNILNFIENIHKNQSALLTVDNPFVFSECIDDFIDEQSLKVEYSTITQRLRYLRWYLLYRCSVESDFDSNMIDDIDQTIEDMQSVSTNNITNKSLINIYDPYRLAKLGNDVVALLCDIQYNTIDPFIVRFFTDRKSITSEDLKRFGNIHLKCWLELLIRFTNVPLRIQGTTGLVMPDYKGMDYISKLSIGTHRIYRIVNRDKLGDYKQIVRIPLDEISSGYMMFYITYCRPDPTSKFVFQSQKGNIWKKASNDLKSYLSQYNIKCDDLYPNGRFIHFTRNIGIAIYSIMCDFDIQKIRNYCTLIRNQLINMEHIYSPWLKVEQSHHACRELMKVRDTKHLFEIHNIPKIEIKHIDIPRHIVRKGFITLFQNHCNENINTTSIVRTKDVSTSTRDISRHHDINNNEIQDHNMEVETCRTCSSSYSILGPVALQRHKHFGKYFTQCIKCNGKYICQESCIFALGVKPNQNSISYKPRNIDEIQKYINQHTLTHTNGT